MLDFYTLQETLKILTKSSNSEYTYTSADIATLCRQGALTPVFAYNSYGMQLLEYYDENKPLPSKNGGETEYDTSRAPEPMTTSLYDNYFTHERLTSLLDNSGGNLVINNAMTYESDGLGYEVVLVANALNVRKYFSNEDYSVYSDNDGCTITRESLLFPREQVQNYIASKQTTEQNTPEQQRIAALESNLKQALADNAKLKQQNSMPTNDDKELPPNSQAAITRLLNVLFHMGKHDLSAHSGTLNQQLVKYSEHPDLGGKTITKNFLTTWLKRVQDLRTEIEDKNRGV